MGGTWQGWVLYHRMIAQEPTCFDGESPKSLDLLNFSVESVTWFRQERIFQPSIWGAGLGLPAFWEQNWDLLLRSSGRRLPFRASVFSTVPLSAFCCPWGPPVWSSSSFFTGWICFLLPGCRCNRLLAALDVRGLVVWCLLINRMCIEFLFAAPPYPWPRAPPGTSNPWASQGVCVWRQKRHLSLWPRGFTFSVLTSLLFIIQKMLTFMFTVLFLLFLVCFHLRFDGDQERPEINDMFGFSQLTWF